MAAALVNLVRDRSEAAKSLFFWATTVGIVIFTSFSVGDQIFGDRAELWEHGTFVILIMVSWFAHRYYNTEDTSHNTTEKSHNTEGKSYNNDDQSVTANAGNADTQSKVNIDELLHS